MTAPLTRKSARPLHAIHKQPVAVPLFTKEARKCSPNAIFCKTKHLFAVSVYLKVAFWYLSEVKNTVLYKLEI
jgi:hypothetical protein